MISLIRVKFSEEVGVVVCYRVIDGGSRQGYMFSIRLRKLSMNRVRLSRNGGRLWCGWVVLCYSVVVIVRVSSGIGDSYQKLLLLNQCVISCELRNGSQLLIRFIVVIIVIISGWVICCVSVCMCFLVFRISQVLFSSVQLVISVVLVSIVNGLNQVNGLFWQVLFISGMFCISVFRIMFWVNVVSSELRLNVMFYSWCD